MQTSLQGVAHFQNTMKFDKYETALQFAEKSGILGGTRPYKRLVWKDGHQVVMWCVTLAKGFQSQTTNVVAA
jgi:hypothetical protein